MMVAMGHGLYVSFCVCAETTKNKVGPKKSDGALELIDRARLATAKLAQVARSNKQQNAGVEEPKREPKLPSLANFAQQLIH
jgi:hypothetical protein